MSWLEFHNRKNDLEIFIVIWLATSDKDIKLGIMDGLEGILQFDRCLEKTLKKMWNFKRNF